MYEIKSEDGLARTGTLKTARGKIKTPFFMPVATKGAVKFVSHKELLNLNYECFISNSLVLFLRPGLEIIKQAGGLHKFIGWDKGIFTDSGGFQVMSFGDEFFLGKNDKGLQFKSPFDGKKHMLTPELCIEIQETLGSDIAMALDDMPISGISYDDAIVSLKNTHTWMEQCKKLHTRDKQLLFGIAQGGIFEDLREKSIKFIDKLDFDGIAFGGLAIGEEKEDLYNMVKLSVKHCSKDKPRYLMGVGSPTELVNFIAQGVDCFDSVFPTRNARHGHLFTSEGSINIDNGEYKTDLRPIDEECKCEVCKKYTRAFMCHLIRNKEGLGKILASHHNLFFIQDLIQKSRKAIESNEFEEFRKDFVDSYESK